MITGPRATASPATHETWQDVARPYKSDYRSWRAPRRGGDKRVAVTMLPIDDHAAWGGESERHARASRASQRDGDRAETARAFVYPEQQALPNNQPSRRG